MNISRAVSQRIAEANGAKTTPAWVAALPWFGEAAAASDGKAAKAKIEHVIGWGPSLQLACGVPTSTPEGRSEPSTRTTADANRPNDPVCARWADGYTKEISELANKLLAERRSDNAPHLRRENA